MPEVSQSKLRLVKTLNILKQHSSKEAPLTSGKISDFLVAEGLEAPTRNTISSDLAVLQAADARVKTDEGKYGWYYDTSDDELDFRIPKVFDAYSSVYLIRSYCGSEDIVDFDMKKGIVGIIHTLTNYGDEYNPKGSLAYIVNTIRKGIQENRYIEFFYMYCFDYEDDGDSVIPLYKTVTTLMAEARLKDNRSQTFHKKIKSDEDVPVLPFKFKVLPVDLQIHENKLYLVAHTDVITRIRFSICLIENISLSHKAQFSKQDIKEHINNNDEFVDDIYAIDQYVLNTLDTAFNTFSERGIQAVKKFGDRQNLVLHCHMTFALLLSKKYQHNGAFIDIDDEHEDITRCTVRIKNLPFNNRFARLVAEHRHLIDHEEFITLMVMFRQKQMIAGKSYIDKDDKNNVEPTVVDWTGKNSSPNIKSPSMEVMRSRVKAEMDLVKAQKKF